MWVIATALASCQQAAEPPTLGEPVAEAAGYPSLHTVPPRPQLSYPVEQRQAIIEGLIADRENARYSNQAVRYRTSLSGLPPPDAPPVAVASPPPDEAANAEAPAPRDQAPERSVIGPEIDSVYEDDDDFDTFLENLARDGAAPRGGTVGPQSNAAPLAPTIVRAGAVRRVSTPPPADDGRPPGVVWAIPVGSPGAPETSASGMPVTKVAPPSEPRVMAGRTPGVVWGMVDQSTRPAARAGSPPGIRQPPPPPATAPPGRAPGVVWGMVSRAEPPAGPDEEAKGASQAASAPPAAAAPAGERNQADDRDQSTAAPKVVALAGPPDDRAPSVPGPPDDQAASAAGSLDDRASTAPAAGTSGIEVANGLVALAPASAAETPAAASIAFAPGSATLPPEAEGHLERFLAQAKAVDGPIKVVGVADAPGLALDRALAVGVALVRRGVAANRLELTLGQDTVGDEARLFLASSGP